MIPLARPLPTRAWARPVTLAAAVVGVLTATFASGACREVLGIDDRVVGGEGGGSSVGKCDRGQFATLPQPACNECLNRSCCDALDGCSADARCASCLSPDGQCTDPPDSYLALAECVHGNCQEECYPTPDVVPDIIETYGDLSPGSGECVTLGGNVTCNPMRMSATCNYQMGAACDATPRGAFPNANGFGCYLSHRHHINEACGLVEGTCHFGLTCVNYRCARMCCVDADCGATGRCDPAYMDWKFGGAQPSSSTVGICVKK